MAERMHPQDLRAIGMFAYDAANCVMSGMICKPNRVDRVLAEVERTANPEPIPGPPPSVVNGLLLSETLHDTHGGLIGLLYGYPNPGYVLDRMMKAEAHAKQAEAERDAAQARAEKAEAEADEIGSELVRERESATEILRFKEQERANLSSELDAALARVRELEADERTYQGYMRAYGDALGIPVHVAPPRYHEDILAALQKALSRLAAIDAAREGEPNMPTACDFDEDTCKIGGKLRRRVEKWGRQGWDAAAALRVELDGAKHTCAALDLRVQELVTETVNVKSRLARYEAQEGEVEPWPHFEELKSYDPFLLCQDYATRLRDRLVGALADLAEAKKEDPFCAIQAREEGRKEERQRIIRALNATTAKGGIPFKVVSWSDGGDVGRMPLNSSELEYVLAPKEAPNA